MKSRPAVGTLVLLLAAHSAGAATVTLVDDFRRMSATQMGVAIVDNVRTVDFLDTQQDEATDPGDTLQEVNLAQSRGSNPPGLYSATTRGQQTSAYLTPGGAAPAFGEPIEGFTVDGFDAFTWVQVTDPFLSSTTSTIGQVSVEIELSEDLLWSWSADVSLEEEGVVGPTYLFSIYDNSGDLFADSREEPFADSVQQGGVLPAGQWTIEVFVSGGAFLTAGSGSGATPAEGMGRVTINNGRFTLSAVPEPGTFLMAAVAVCGVRRRGAR